MSDNTDLNQVLVTLTFSTSQVFKLGFLSQTLVFSHTAYINEGKQHVITIYPRGLETCKVFKILKWTFHQLCWEKTIYCYKLCESLKFLDYEFGIFLSQRNASEEQI